MVSRVLLFSALCAIAMAQTTSNCEENCAVEVDGTCTQCTSGYTLRTSYANDVIVASSCDMCDSHCSDACNTTSNSSYSCEICESGYFSYFGSCFTCAGKTDTTTCNETTACASGHHLTFYGVCMPAAAFVCEVVAETSVWSPTSCDSVNNTGCASGYSFTESSKSCTKCAAACSDATATCNSTCVGNCNNGYYKVQPEGADGGVCYACPPGCTCPTTTQTEQFFCSSCSGSDRLMEISFDDKKQIVTDKQSSSMTGHICVGQCLAYITDFGNQGCPVDDDADEPWNYCGQNETNSGACCKILSDFYGAGCTFNSVQSLFEDPTFGQNLFSDYQPAGTMRLTASDYDSYETLWSNTLGQELGTTAENARYTSCLSAYPEADNCTSAELGDFYTATCANPVIAVDYSIVLASAGTTGDLGYTAEQTMALASSVVAVVADALDVDADQVSVTNATFVESSDTLLIEFAVLSPNATVDSTAVATAMDAITDASIISALSSSGVSVPSDLTVTTTSTVDVVAVETPTQSPASAVSLALPLMALVAFMFRM